MTPIGMLPFTAASLEGLLFLLDRWAFRSERCCGFREHDYKKNAFDLMQALWRCLWSDRPWSFELDLVRVWATKWPCPHESHDGIVVRCSAAGVDLSEWRAKAAQHGQHSFAHTSWQVLEKQLPPNPSFFDFLRELAAPASWEKLGSLALQVFHLGGAALQRLILAGTKGGATPGMSVSRVELSDLFAQRRRLDSYLLRYVLSAQPRAKGQQYWSVCTDKAACGGFNLQAGLAVFPDNLGIVLPPAVPTCECFGRPGLFVHKACGQRGRRRF